MEDLPEELREQLQKIIDSKVEEQVQTVKSEYEG